jgi:hypothetical protein
MAGFEPAASCSQSTSRLSPDVAWHRLMWRSPALIIAGRGLVSPMPARVGSQLGSQRSPLAPLTFSGPALSPKPEQDRTGGWSGLAGSRRLCSPWSGMRTLGPWVLIWGHPGGRSWLVVPGHLPALAMSPGRLPVEGAPGRVRTRTRSSAGCRCRTGRDMSGLASGLDEEDHAGGQRPQGEEKEGRDGAGVDEAGVDGQRGRSHGCAVSEPPG